MTKSSISFTENLKTYFKGVKAEWGKITWPEKKMVIAETIYVVGVVIVFTLFILLLDVSFRGLFKMFKLM